MNTKEQNALQTHHDHYVRLFKAGKLGSEDQPQYELAMRRERLGQVKPLPMAWYLKLGLLILMTAIFFGLMWLTSRYGGWLGGFQTLAFSFEGLLWVLTSLAVLFNRN